jgi:hypothetical protein
MLPDVSGVNQMAFCVQAENIAVLRLRLLLLLVVPEIVTICICCCGH